MNAQQHAATKHIINALLSRGVLVQGDSTSWPTPTGIEYGWKVRTARLANPLTVSVAFDEEEELLIREANAYTRQVHGAAITASFLLVQDTLYRDLAVIHRLRLAGKSDLPVPDQIVIKEVKVDLAGWQDAEAAT